MKRSKMVDVRIIASNEVDPIAKVLEDWYRFEGKKDYIFIGYPRTRTSVKVLLPKMLNDLNASESITTEFGPWKKDKAGDAFTTAGASDTHEYHLELTKSNLFMYKDKK